MSDNFTGRWLVNEYVHNADGTFVGIVQQKRYLETLDNGQIRVIQDCDPSPELSEHVMGGFKGQWEFDLQREGRFRQYLGPDVIGTGYPFGDKDMIGEGIWTQFGHNFTSFAFLSSPQRQLTGGTFYNSGEIVSKIVGIAHPETADTIDQFPHLEMNYQPHLIANTWRGVTQRYDIEGTLLSETETERKYEQDRRIETDSNNTIQLEGIPELNSNTLKGTIQGKEVYGKLKCYGCYTEDVLYSSAGDVIRTQTIFDSQEHQVTLLRTWHQNQIPQFIDIARLRPD